MPKRIRLRRTAGWRKPNDTIVVTRSTRFGNPFKVEEHGRDRAIAMFEVWIQQPEQKPLLDDARRALRGKDLACWCRLDERRHADILLRLVNS